MQTYLNVLSIWSGLALNRLLRVSIPYIENKESSLPILKVRLNQDFMWAIPNRSAVRTEMSLSCFKCPVLWQVAIQLVVCLKIKEWNLSLNKQYKLTSLNMLTKFLLWLDKLAWDRIKVLTWIIWIFFSSSLPQISHKSYGSSLSKVV